MNEKVIIWGAGNLSRLLLQRCKFLGYDVLAFYDSNTNKQGNVIDGVLVINKEKFIDYNNVIPDFKVIIASRNEQSCNNIIESFKQIFVTDQPELLMLPELEKNYSEKAKKQAKQIGDYSVDLKKSIYPWLSGIMSEVSFWCGVSVELMQGKIQRQHENFYCRRIMDIVKPGDTVFDVGCGLFSQYGSNLKSNSKDTWIELKAIDPLKSFYNKINAQCSRKVNKVEFGMFELMSEFYVHNSADIILIDNALDHSIDPYKSILECLQILKPGGCLSLRHRCLEGIREYYWGLHNWNLDYENDDFVIWNNDNYVNVSKQLKNEVDIIVEHEEEEVGEYICVNLFPNAKYDITHYTDTKINREYMANVIEMLMQLLSSEEVNSLFKRNLTEMKCKLIPN